MLLKRFPLDEQKLRLSLFKHVKQCFLVYLQKQTQMQMHVINSGFLNHLYL